MVAARRRNARERSAGSAPRELFQEKNFSSGPYGTARGPPRGKYKTRKDPGPLSAAEGGTREPSARFPLRGNSAEKRIFSSGPRQSHCREIGRASCRERV